MNPNKIHDLVMAGAALANIAFNLKQRPGEPLTSQVCASMSDAQAKWDAARNVLGIVPAYQERVRQWLLTCFGAAIASDPVERNHRFLEESLELVQACGCSQSEAHQLVDYVFGRPVGEKAQEVGGVMVTLAALCLAQGLDMHEAGEVEQARIWTKVEQIRAKQAAKPKHSPLPVAQPVTAAGAERRTGCWLVEEFDQHGTSTGRYLLDQESQTTTEEVDLAHTFAQESTAATLAQSMPEKHGSTWRAIRHEIASAPMVGGGERKQFEEVVRGFFDPARARELLTRDDGGNYIEWALMLAWEAWQARAALATRPHQSGECTCPSGNGSLRWPCPRHAQASALAEGDDTWSLYVAGMVGAYLGWGVDDDRIPVIGGIIQRRRYLAGAMLAARPATTEQRAQEEAAKPEGLLPHGYLFAKVGMVMPLFQEARDALTALTEVQRRTHGISPTLADRMDYAGTFSLDDWYAAAREGAIQQEQSNATI